MSADTEYHVVHTQNSLVFYRGTREGQFVRLGPYHKLTDLRDDIQPKAPKALYTNVKKNQQL